MTLTVWLGFLLAAIVIAVTPGPGAVISMSTGIRRGYWAALTAILGLQAALLIQLLIVALGLGALLAASETAFSTIKLLGAGYLLWLDITSMSITHKVAECHYFRDFVRDRHAGDVRLCVDGRASGLLDARSPQHTVAEQIVRRAVHFGGGVVGHFRSSFLTWWGNPKVLRGVICMRMPGSQRFLLFARG